MALSNKDAKKYVGTLDIEPTWSALLPWMLAVMARAADAYRALQKEGKVP